MSKTREMGNDGQRSLLMCRKAAPSLCIRTARTNLCQCLVSLKSLLRRGDGTKEESAGEKGDSKAN